MNDGLKEGAFILRKMLTLMDIVVEDKLLDGKRDRVVRSCREVIKKIVLEIENE